MRETNRLHLCLALLLLLLIPALAGKSSTASAGSAEGLRAEQEARSAFGKLPLVFVPNRGQTDARVRFSAHAVGAGFYFTPEEAVFSFSNGSPGKAEGIVLRLAFLGANPNTTIEGQRLGTGKVNYFIGNDPSRWRTGLPTYGRVAYHDLWPGVDMVFRGGSSRLKYEFVVRPGARVDDIRLAYSGAKRLSLDKAGQLLIGTALGTLKDARPVSYQEVGGRRIPVESSFLLRPDGRNATSYGFAVGDYDARQPLVIDPGLLYSTYLGGNNSDLGNPIAVDSAGNAYVTGETSSSDFPTTAGAFDTVRDGVDAFVTKLNAAGTAQLYSTFLGGGSADRGFGIALDPAGNAYVSGETASNNFPLSIAFDPTYNGNIDAFVTKLNAAGNALAYSTYLGGSNADRGHEIAVDGAGSAYVTGETLSGGANPFPTTGGAFDTSFNGQSDVFVTKFNPVGSGLLYSTYLGGAQNERGDGITVDGAGSAYVTGRTAAPGFPTTAGAFDTSHNGGDDVFVTKLNATGTAPLLYSTFMGGNGSDRGFGITRDAANNVYVTGETQSSAFPTTAGAFDTVRDGNDAFVTKLNAAGSAQLYSTFLGGNSAEIGYGIAVDSAGNAYVTGETTSAGFPTTPFAFDTSYNSNTDAFVTKMNAAGSAQLYSTYLGGSNADRGFGIKVDTTGNAFVTGETLSGGSNPFPTTAGAFDTSYNTDGDAFVTKLDMIAAVPATLTLAPAADSNPVGTSHTVTATVKDADGDPVPGATVRFSASGANSASGSDVTDANGEATFTYTGTTAGGDTITAYADTDGDNTQDAGEPSGAATKTWTPSGPATLTLSPAADSNAVGTSHTVTGTVKDAGGNPVSGVTVRFSVTGVNSASGSDTTDANGEATFTYSGTTVGPDTINAFADTNGNGTQNAGEPGGTAAKTWTPGAPATLTLTPATDSNTVGTNHTVTATVRDIGTNPVPGVTVRFSVTGANSASGTDTTDANGEAPFTYSGTTAGLDTISAFADTNNDGDQDTGEPSGTATKTWTPGAPATLTLTPAADSNEVGTNHTVTATVKDAFNNPVPGVTVRFSVTGTHSASGSDVTDASGEATFTYSVTTVGTDTIGAFADTNNDGDQDAGEPSGTATKTWTPGPPATLTLSPATATNTVGNPHTLTATVKDQFGNATPGIVVRFSVSGANSTSGSDVTDTNGEASFTYTGTTAGTDTIAAFADTNANTTQDSGEPSDTATKTWEPGPPATLDLTPATAVNVVGTEHCVTATVKDAFGNPVPDVTVRFSVTPATFPSPSSGSDVTDENGEATFCYSASLPGEDAIHAYADTDGDSTQDAGEPFGDATKTWTVPPSTALCEVTITEGGWIVANNGDRANFGGNAKVLDDGSSVQGQEEYQDQGPVDPRDVHSIELLATTCSDDLTSATIFGTATIDGSGEYVFRIDVIDMGEPGTNDSYGIMMSDLYVSGQKQLQGGNVKIHKGTA